MIGYALKRYICGRGGHFERYDVGGNYYGCACGASEGPCYDFCACKHCWRGWNLPFRTLLGHRISQIWWDKFHFDPSASRHVVRREGRLYVNGWPARWVERWHYRKFGRSSDA